MNFITFFDKISRLLFWPRSSAAEQLPLKQLAGGSNPPGVTTLDCEGANWLIRLKAGDNREFEKPV